MTLPIYSLKLLPVGVAFAIGQICTNVSLSIVSVGLTHVIKISEPSIAVLGGFLLLGDAISNKSMVYISLLLTGVALTAVNDATFNSRGIIFAGVSNVFLQGRNILIKYIQKSSADDGGKVLFKGLPLFTSTMGTGFQFLTIMLGCYCVFIPGTAGIVLICLQDYMTYFVGVCFACQHLLSYYVLSNITVTTHALFNSIKRALIIIISCIVLNTPLKYVQMFGVTMACFFFYMYLKEKATNSSNTTTVVNTPGSEGTPSRSQSLSTPDV